ncbi:MAG: CDGSH iron-sulfur domain-containing protein [Gammaproteobacteria bacterium]|nr:CDGSH iron-sulfur domain-containing protein [Gammaproteobacteria bacterium]
MSNSVTIKAAPDGPYIVKNLQNFSNRKGAIECKEAMGLCRCGQSANKPYCDGSHKNVGFSSENQLNPARDRRDTYQGKKITVYDNRSICAHAGICTDGLPAVFHNREGSFVEPDGASVAEIIDIVNQCPSGALSYIIDDESETRLIDEASIQISPNGPYVLKGKVVLLDMSKGEGASESHSSLCRCGASKNKPFCDGSHWDINFTDDEN